MLCAWVHKRAILNGLPEKTPSSGRFTTTAGRGMVKLLPYVKQYKALEDAGSSLTAALGLIKQLREFSGLQINWDKSQILPLDIGPPTAHKVNLPLLRTSHMKYLGVQVSRSTSEYARLNVEPLYTMLKLKTQI